MGHKATYVNAYPFVWNNYREAGFVTGKQMVLKHSSLMHIGMIGMIGIGMIGWGFNVYDWFNYFY